MKNYLKNLLKKTKYFAEKMNGNSLRTRFVAILFLCWIIPMTCLGICGILMYRSYNMKIDAFMLSDFNYAGEFSCERLSTAYNDVCDLTYDKVLENFYIDYLNGKISERKLNQMIKNCTNTKYPPANFLMTDIVLKSNKNKHYYLSAMELSDWKDYIEGGYETIKNEANSSKSGEMFFIRDEKIYLVRKLIHQDDYAKLQIKKGDSFGLFITVINSDFAFEYFKSGISWNGKMVYSINDIAGKFGNCSEEYLKEATGSTKLIDRGGKTVVAGLSGNDNIVFKYAIEPSGKEDNALDIFLKMFTFFTILSFPLLIISAVIFHYKIDKPIDELVKATKSIEQGNLGININYEGQDEFKYLIESFNHMSEEIKWLFDYTYKEEIALKEAKLRALRSQINPHFLNNTLEMINWKARMSGQEELSKMIESLSIVFDASMSRSNKQLITIKEELRCVNAYMYIILKRFGSRLTVNKDIDQSLMDINIPPLIVQPLVENAIVHGIEPVGSGSLTLRVYRKGESAVIEVENDGSPLSREDVEKISAILKNSEFKYSERQSIGVKNVSERLNLIFGERSNFDIYLTENGSTVSKIVLPIE